VVGVKYALQFRKSVRIEGLTGYFISKVCRTRAASSPHMMSFSSTESDMAYIIKEAIKSYYAKEGEKFFLK